jgi:predicted transcriptional regulator
MTIKEQVRQLAEKLPETATWDDVAYEVYVRQRIARGLEDMKAGRLISDEEIRREFLK